MKQYIEKCLAGEHLTVDESADALERIMRQEATDVQIGALLVAMRAKGETVEELVGFATTMRRRAYRVRVDDPDAVDMCGTGGDGAGTFNISTASALVAAGAGVTVAKHGNRSVSSRSGSADVLSALGVKIQIPVEKVEECVNSVGIGFLFAPSFHPAMKVVAGPRKELGIRTIFNMIGPITNPAGVRRQLVGTYHPDVAARLAGALRLLSAHRACVVHGHGGIDEVAVSGETRVFEVDGENPLAEYVVTPEMFGLSSRHANGVHGGDAEENARITMGILENRDEPRRDVVVANAGFGVYIAGRAGSLGEGAAMASESIASGSALRTLNRLVEFTNRA
jgi:anthranilate phosphoribosyltransferase